MSISENGKSKKIGPILLSGSGGDQFFLCRYNQNEQSYSDKIAYEIDQEMQSFIEYCYDRAKNILLENKDKLELIAKTLLDIETLDERQIKGLFEDGILSELEFPEKEVDDVEEYHI